MSRTYVRPYNADGNEHQEAFPISTEEALECPFCFAQIEVQPLRGVMWENKGPQLFLKCKKCKNCFIGYLKQDGPIFRIISLSKGNTKIRKFPLEIEEVSPSFVKIYGEANHAEQENLLEVCGVGYRKALEFLIKDYLISKFPQKKDEIIKKDLGACIGEMMENGKIKEIAKRAVWLGNDETHYFRKWEGKDLADLKTLIEITVHFIAMEVEADRYMRDMN